MIAREGWPVVAVTLVFAAVLAHRLGVVWTLPAAALLGCLVYVYGYPSRGVPADPLAVVCPADGCVRGVREAHDPWLARAAQVITVALPAPGITVLRSPAEGKVMDFWTRPGAGGAALSPVGYAMWIRTDEGDDIVFSLGSRRSISRFKADVSPGERVGQGKRFAFVYFGGWVEVLVPASSEVLVAEGQRVRAGSDAVATLVHS